MGGTIRTGRAVTTVLAALVVAGGCAPMGGVLRGPGHDRGRVDVLEGEVRRVDARRGRLDVRSRNGYTRSLLVHRDTRVVYQGRTYPVSALEPGDGVRVHVTVDRRGDAWAERVDVRRSARARRAPPVRRAPPARPAVRVTRLEGVVRDVDPRDGWFSVDPPGRARRVVVHVSRRLDRRDEIRVGHLRRGQRVRLDVVALDRDEAELVRFR